MSKREDDLLGQLQLDTYSFFDWFQNGIQTLQYTPFGQMLKHLPGVGAHAELLFMQHGHHEDPKFGIAEVLRDGKVVCVEERIAHSLPFCDLIYFATEGDERRESVLLFAPLSGHHATLLRETVKSLLPDFRVFITRFKNARDIALEAGVFGFDEYVAYARKYVELMTKVEQESTRKRTPFHIIAVCQPAPPVFAALSLQAQDGSALPESLVLIGGPIDTRVNPTLVNKLARDHPESWFRQNVIYPVSQKYKGARRRVYPGLVQLAAFIQMNPRRHVDAMGDYRKNLYLGNIELAQRHLAFYQEYCSVLDIPEEFFLDTIRMVFREDHLPLGIMEVNGMRVDPSRLPKKMRIMVIEGARDDIVGLGQCAAALALAKNVAPSNQEYFVAEDSGHFGIFGGEKYNKIYYPQKLRPFLLQ